MKLLLSILILLPIINASYMSGSFTIPKHMPILSQSDLLKAAHKPGLLAWRFYVPSNSSETSITLQGLEPIARLAEKKLCDLSMRIEIDQKRNISMALDKCGLQSTTSTTVMQREIIIVPPSYFTVLSNVGLVGCKKIETPMHLLIHGDFNTSGTISINVLEYPTSAKMLVEDVVIYYVYPILFGILFILAGFAFSSMICCAKNHCLPIFNKHQSWTEYAQLRIVYGHQGTHV